MLSPMSVGQKQFHGMTPISVTYECRLGHQVELESTKHVARDRGSLLSVIGRRPESLCPMRTVLKSYLALGLALLQ